MYISPIQKVILESISTSPKSLDEISQDIKLENIQVLRNIQSLLKSEYVLKYKSKYSLNSIKKSKINEALNHRETKVFDIKKISESFFHSSSKLDQKINFKKVHLSQDEMKTVSSLLKQLDFYLNEKMNKKSSQPLYKKHIFYWGKQTYEEAYL